MQFGELQGNFFSFLFFFLRKHVHKTKDLISCMEQCDESNGKVQKVDEIDAHIQTWVLKLIRAVQVLEGGVAGGGGMLTVQHLSRLGPQGAIVSKGTGPPPLVTGRRVKPIIGEAWEIQYRVGRGGDSIIVEMNFCQSQSQCPDC